MPATASPEQLAATQSHEDELKVALRNSVATIAAIYAWIDQVNDAGGVYCLPGVAKAAAMLKSLNGQRERLDKLVMEPAHRLLAKKAAQ